MLLLKIVYNFGVDFYLAVHCEAPYVRVAQLCPSVRSSVTLVIFTARAMLALQALY